jgi:hypothetical protein
MGSPSFEGMARSQTPIDMWPEAMRLRLLGSFRVSKGAKSIDNEEWPLGGCS